ncbi:MAG: COQ9 family protein [Alphaproteobacteria bacterium]|nr:COQ9 family protein [Alphaproteobacteria bacterium]
MTTGDEMRDEILLAALPHVPFDGWSVTALARGAVDAGHDAAAVKRLFPGGAPTMIAAHNRYADQIMLEELARRDLDTMKVRERIITAVRVRLEQNAPHREAVRRGLATLALPHHAALATRLLYRTVDAMWHAAGDTSTDYNFYTKRALLAGVYSATLMCWLNDNSDDFQATWAFLDRRVAEVLQVPKVMARAGRVLGRLPDPFRLLRTARST